LRRENLIMRETLKKNKLRPDGTTLGPLTSTPPEYQHSSKPFASLLRGVSPKALRASMSTPPKSITPRPSKQQPRNDPSVPQRKGQYSAADPLRSSSKSPNPVRNRPASSLPDLKSGTKVIWGGNDAVVRFVGNVHCLGTGTWIGLELHEEGKGEHNGTLGGVRYFVTGRRQAVFCKAAELSMAPKPQRLDDQKKDDTKKREPSPESEKKTESDRN
jgi:hypothetical protein